MTVYTIWGQGAVSSASQGANNDYTVIGTLFTLSESASLTGIWFYSDSGSVALPYGCCIYDVPNTDVLSGTENSSPSWSGSKGSGWVKCSYDGSVTLQASHSYIVAVVGPDTPGGNWLSFTTGTDYPLTSGIITAPSSGSGPYTNAPGTAFTYPGSSVSGYSWWVDVEVTTGGTSHTATASLTVTPSFSAARVRGKFRTGGLTVSPSFSAARVRGKYRTGALTVTPSLSAARTRGRYRSAVLTVTPSFSAARVRGKYRTAALAVAAVFSAARQRGRHRTASLTVTPAFSAAAVVPGSGPALDPDLLGGLITSGNQYAGAVQNSNLYAGSIT